MIKNLYRIYLKRIFDFVLASVLIIPLIPLSVFLIPIISISNKGPILFLQRRPGMNGKIFKLYKFKTMTDERDCSGRLLPDKMRITRVGRFIRSFSLDELPQLINVITGRMSIVGPRPLLPEYMKLYSENHSRRHAIRPGITGWAQVNGRNEQTWKDRLDYDIWYVDNISFWLDVKIIGITIFNVFRRKGIQSGNSVTMDPFTGL